MENTENQTAQITSDETAENTGAQETGTATQTATEAKPEKTFTQQDVDRIVQNRLKSAVKAELKKLTGETETVTVEELQRQLTEAKERTRTYEASSSIRDYVADPKNKLNVKGENIRAIEKLVLAELEYDSEGKPANLKEALESVKSYAPALFAQTNGNINQGNGKTPVTNADMNDFIRQQHAGRF